MPTSRCNWPTSVRASTSTTSSTTPCGIQQYFEPTLDADPVDLEARGLATGDTVEVFNDRGGFSVQVHANPAIRSGSVRLCEGATADYLARGNMQSVTNDAQVERGSESFLRGPVIPFNDTLVEIKKA